MKVYDGNRIIEFESLPNHFKSEMLNGTIKGAKPNTVRFVNSKNHQILKNLKKSGTLEWIRIVNTSTNETFTRKITDFRPYHTSDVIKNKTCWIFSFTMY